ncbi:MAG: acyl-homoserine-lactone synthase [Hyphomonadaceae bacterium]|nr:acyl-homoserine-lactone synthase [Hyphomonadaceae bacterium]
MDVHVVTGIDAAGWGPALAAMGRQRARLFVDTLGWRGLVVRDGEERDAFDTSAATYLLAIDADGEVRGSLRLLPTTGVHMMAAVFPGFVDGPPPCGPDILEWSRHAPGLPGWPPAVTEAARLALHLGVLEFAAARGVTAFTALMETWLVRRARALGWACTPLGPQQSYGEGQAMAVINPVTPGHLQALRARTGWNAPVLRALPAAA